jgi:tetratricopeptide (TPR) repeat protein
MASLSLCLGFSVLPPLYTHFLSFTLPAGFIEVRYTHHARCCLLSLKLGLEHPALIDVLNQLGQIHHASGALDEALKVFQRVVAIKFKHAGPSEPVYDDYCMMVGFHMQMEDVKGAYGCIQKALEIAEEAFGPSDPRTVEAKDQESLLKSML